MQYWSDYHFIESKKVDVIDDKVEVDTFSILPNEWTLFQLSREQRLKIYEKAIEVFFVSILDLKQQL